MKTIFVFIAFILLAFSAHAQNVAPTTSSLSCPQGYALDVGQPTQMPPDDPNQPPKTEAQRQQEDQAAMAEQFSHWRCVPINKDTASQPQQMGQ